MADPARFVIQLHDATTLHFDLRLEVDGVLRSWAVPKGLSLDPRDRRLAVPVADHELAHGDFEGVLPDARRGSGAVIVWDHGLFRPLGEGPVGAALDAGHAAIRLDGIRLAGGWALTRVATGADPRWIVVKMRDAEADPGRDIVAERPESVVSGRTIAELAGAAT
jgi:DNA ligase D-like protein (predicted 3'-phosphoesterase)